jgi:hypothetical protein
MASWKEIDRVRKDPKGFRALAARLLAHTPDLTDWERDNFLPSIMRQSEKEEFTTRQSEKVLQIRDDYENVTQLPGNFSVRLILRACNAARLDLSEDDEAWISQRIENQRNHDQAQAYRPAHAVRASSRCDSERIRRLGFPRVLQMD